MKKLVQESLFEYDEQIHSRIQDESEENEGAHYKVKLEETVQMAEDLYSKLPEGQIPAWVGDKIVVAKEYLYAVTGWLHGVEEEIEGEEEGANREMDSEEEHEEVEDDLMLDELPGEVEDMVDMPATPEDIPELSSMPVMSIPKIR